MQTERKCCEGILLNPGEKSGEAAQIVQVLSRKLSRLRCCPPVGCGGVSKVAKVHEFSKLETFHGNK